MIKEIVLKIKIYVFLAIFIVPVGFFEVAMPQDNDLPVQEIRKKAYHFFKINDYKQASVYFTQLLNKFPRDPDYQYHLGICLLELNQDVPTAKQLLAFSSTRGVPSNVYFYMGIANLKTYNLYEAGENLRRFENLANRREKRNYDVHKYYGYINNAQELIKNANVTNVFGKEEVKLDDIPDKLNELPVNIKAVKTDEFSRLPFNLDILYNFFLHQENLENDDYFYYSSKSGRGNYDIYRVRYVDGNSWGAPEPLGKVINSSGDEIFPYFDNHTSTLYFSSNGNKSMGGYDIFSSKYNKHSNSWEEPVNLGFPVNSPGDEILYIPRSDSQSFYLLSDRGSVSGYINLYELAVSGIKYQGIDKYVPEQYNALALLEVNTKSTDNGRKVRYSSEKDNHSARLIETVRTEMEYTELLSMALNMQLLSDSLLRQSLLKKGQLRETLIPEQRKALFEEIASLENRAASIQKEADRSYALVRDYEVKNLNNPNPKATYSPPDKSNPQIGVANGNNISSPIDKSTNKDNSNLGVGGFSVLNSSPYSENNPFQSNASFPEGVAYKIQLGVFRNPVPYDNFKGLTPITTEFIAERNLTRYYVGLFQEIAVAERALETVKQHGFREAFIVSFYDGKKISIVRAREIEEYLR